MIGAYIAEQYLRCHWPHGAACGCFIVGCSALVFYGSTIFSKPMDFPCTADCYLWRILENFLGGCLPFHLPHRHRLSYLPSGTMGIETLLLSLTSSPSTLCLSGKLLFVFSCDCGALRHTQLFATVLSSAAHLHCQNVRTSLWPCHADSYCFHWGTAGVN